MRVYLSLSLILPVIALALPDDATLSRLLSERGGLDTDTISR